MLQSQGSLVAGGDDSHFSWSYTDASISMWNSAFTVPMPNGKTVSIPATGSSTSPAWSFTGLAASTTYHFGAYFDLIKTVVVVVLSDVSGGTAPGSQTWLVQTIQGDNHIPLFSDLQIATAASGQQGSTGGGSPGGGSPTCPADDQEIETQERGFIPAGELQPGMHVRGWAGEWNEILETRSVRGWLHFVTIAGEKFHVDRDHRWLPLRVRPDAPIGKWRRSVDLQPGDALQGADGSPCSVEFVGPLHWGRYIELRAERQRFRLGKIISHNYLTTL